MDGPCCGDRFTRLAWNGFGLDANTLDRLHLVRLSSSLEPEGNDPSMTPRVDVQTCLISARSGQQCLRFPKHGLMKNRGICFRLDYVQKLARRSACSSLPSILFVPR